ncbi:MAG: TrkA family potassium uptake protein [Candidatus Eremiobacteraeota bacterium]|nr:TrkA family potassium uptake protein [Candidatus Eremiobacteraeota bacterium]
MQVVIVGCGRMGAMMANSLSRRGESVIVIDTNDKAFHYLTTEFGGFQLVGDATEIEVLKQAKVEQADLILVLTGDDNINLAVAQICRIYFGVPHTTARVFDPQRETIFEQLGITTICPTKLASDYLLKEINEIQEKLEAGEEEK